MGLGDWDGWRVGILRDWVNIKGECARVAGRSWHVRFGLLGRRLGR